MKMSHSEIKTQLDYSVKVKNQNQTKPPKFPKPHNLLSLISAPLYEMLYCVYLLFDFICIQNLSLFRKKKKTQKQAALLSPLPILFDWWNLGGDSAHFLCVFECTGGKWGKWCYMYSMCPLQSSSCQLTNVESTNMTAEGARCSHFVLSV